MSGKIESGVIVKEIGSEWLNSVLIDGWRELLFEHLSNKLFAGLLVVSKTGRVIWANDKAREMLARQSPLMLGGNSRLSVTVGQETVNLLAEVESVYTQAEAGLKVSRLLILAGDAEKPEVLLRITPAPESRYPGEQTNIVLLLWVYELKRAVKCSAANLKQAYGLTATECRLVSLLVNGYDSQTVASILDITKNTFKSHLKQIFQKTETKRQSELVRLILITELDSH